jgi:hypothetical protein
VAPPRNGTMPELSVASPAAAETNGNGYEDEFSLAELPAP